MSQFIETEVSVDEIGIENNVRYSYPAQHLYQLLESQYNLAMLYTL